MYEQDLIKQIKNGLLSTAKLVDQLSATETTIQQDIEDVIPNPMDLGPFPGEPVVSQDLGESFTIPEDGNPNVIDGASDYIDEIGVEGGEVTCPKCFKSDFLEDNRKKKLEDPDRFGKIPEMSCNDYMDKNGCGWATWNLETDSPLGSEIWKTEYLNGGGAIG